MLTVASISGNVRAETCPGVYDGLDCNDPGAAVCSTNSNVIECDLAREMSGSSGGEIWAVLNEGELCGATADYCMWGTEKSGVEFCCAIEADTGTNKVTVIIRGTDYNDTIHLQADIDSVEYDLSNWSTGFTFTGQVTGNPGNDTIEGSRDPDGEYHDDLSGNGGTDSIYGFAGYDTIRGGSEGDTIEGGPGNDTIYGENGDDTIMGQGNDDTIYGEAGDDVISGGIGVDTLRGDNDEDVICGDNGNDNINGGTADDVLWGGANTDSLDGAGATTSDPGDTCDDDGVDTLTSCETEEDFDRPEECPDAD